MEAAPTIEDIPGRPVGAQRDVAGAAASRGIERLAREIAQGEDTGERIELVPGGGFQTIRRS